MVRLAFGAVLTVGLVAAPVRPASIAEPGPGVPATGPGAVHPLASDSSKVPRDPPQGIAVIVNRDVVDDTDIAGVRRIFLRRQRFWADGALIAPVNLPATSPVRDLFSRTVLGRSPRDMAQFWNNLYFNGVQPPPVVESQRAVLLYVGRTPGAIGYVDAASLPSESDDGFRVALVLTP